MARTDTAVRDDAHVVLVRDPEAFTAAFPSATFLTLDDWPALNNGGDTVYLRHAPSDTPLDSVPYDPSWGGREDRSLERIDPGGPSDTDANFASSEAASGATPGTQNSVYAPDETPPSLARAIPSQNGDSLTVVFSEPVAPISVSPEAFRFDSADAPSIVTAQIDDGSPAQVHCILKSPLSTGEYRLIATGISDLRGNVRDEDNALFSYVVADTPAPGDVVVSEIMYAPAVASNEFIEVYNRSDKTFDLGALQYADDARNFAPAAPPLTPFRPGQYAVLVRDEEAFAEAYPAVAFRAPKEWNALNNGGDTVILRHTPSSTQLDAVPYASSWGGSDGRSLERIDPRGPSDEASNFASSTAPDGATPGAQNSRFAPDTTPPQPAFAEHVDSLTAAVVFSEPIRNESVRSERFRFESVAVTQTQVQADSIVRLSLSDRPTAEAVLIVDVRDRAGNRLDQASLPFARRPTPGALVLNELLFDPQADDFDDRPNQVEYVELRNLTDHTLTLAGLALTDRPTEAGTADTLRVGRRRGLAPGGFAVVAAAPKGALTPQSSQLAAAFPDAPLDSDSVAYLPMQAPTLGLRDDAGDRVRIGPYVVLLEAVQADVGTTTELKETVVVARPLD